MKLKKLLAIIMITVLVFASFTGCKKDEGSSGEGLSNKINELALTVDKVIDLPDWTGKKMKLVEWFAQGTASPYIGKVPTDRTILDEYTRITGISWDEEMSFDNSGMAPDTKIAKILATNTWPDVGYNIEESLISRLAEGDYIWDLTEYIPKYMPNLMKIVNLNEKSASQFYREQIDGKFFFIPKPGGRGVTMAHDPEFSEEKYYSLFTPENSRTSISVRDDILRMIYPDAYTREELEQIYVEKGEFTPEQIKDVTINSIEEFDEFLRKIDALNVTQEGRKVHAFYTHNGTDNWDILRTLGSVLNGALPAMCDYFAYFDREEGKIVRTIDQPWFKDTIKMFSKLVADGIASKEALIDTKATFDQKKNYGEFAVLYGNASAPNKAVLEAAGRDYLYRPVYIDIQPNWDKFLKYNSTEKYFTTERIVIFKKNQITTEEDLEQVLRYFDFFYTPIAAKLYYWGPEDSGLYEETEDGKLRYLDPLMEQDMIYSGANKRKIYYGMNGWPDIANWVASHSYYVPKVQYQDDNAQRIPAQYTKKFRFSEIEKAPSYPDLILNPRIPDWTASVEGITKFWDARQSSEDAFKKVFTATDDAHFEILYKELVDTVTKNGLDEKTMKEWNKKFKEVNKDLWDDFINWEPILD